MKTYTMSFADSTKHVPEHPERTARRSVSWDVTYKVWPSRAAMQTTLDMQAKRAPHPSDWRPCIKLEDYYAVKSIEAMALALA